MITGVLGVDPGLSGALAFLDGDVVEIFDMPTYQITVNGKKKRQLDLYSLGRLVDELAERTILAVIEDVHSMPAQGVTSSFNFGFSAGAAQTVIAANLIKMHLVRPVTWKRAMGLTSDKDASRRRASQLFPRHVGKWSRAMDDGRAEALLLAYYGSRLPQ